MHSTPAHISHSGDSTQSRTALVIDDDPTSRLVAQWLLHRQGYQVSSFKGVSQDIESISSMAPRKPDVIIIDYLLQDCSAIDFIEKLNAIQGFNEIPKIVITAKRSNESERTALAHGVADFITKPLTTSKFVERVALTSAEKQLQSYKHHGWLPTINPLEINPSDLPNSYSVIIVEQKNFDEIAHHQGMNVAHQSMNELAHTLNLLLAPNHVFMSRISLSQIAVISAVVNANDLAPVLSRLNAPYKKT
jgi:response regulator RpfG family c-di-GMP phosphodiesterase